MTFFNWLKRKIRSGRGVRAPEFSDEFLKGEFETLQIKAFPQMPELNVLLIADTHGCFEIFWKDDEDLPPLDAVIILGDLEINDLNSILNRCKGVPVYAICGNHDTPELYKNPGVTYIHGIDVWINGYRIVGWHGSFKYKDTQDHCFNQAESEAFVDDLPSCDILITHDAAYGSRFSTDLVNHPGLKGIKKYLREMKPVIHLHGHLHNPGIEEICGVPSVCVYKFGLLTVKDGQLSYKRLAEHPFF